MASNMNKAVAIIAGIIAVVSIIPIDLLAWWKADVDPLVGSNYSNYINAFGQFYKWGGSEYAVTALDSMFLIAGILTIVGAVLLLLAGAKSIKALAFLGAVLVLVSPIIFMIAQNGNAVLGEIGNLYDRNLLFGTDSIIFWDLGGTTNWYLGFGLWIALGAGVIGFLALKSNR